MENQPKIDPSKIYPDALSDEELKRKRREEESQTMLDFRRQKILNERKNKITNDDVSLAQIAAAFLILTIVLPFFDIIPIVGFFSIFLGIFTPFYLVASIWFAYKSLKAGEKIEKQTQLPAEGRAMAIAVLFMTFAVILIKFLAIFRF